MFMVTKFWTNENALVGTHFAYSGNGNCGLITYAQVGEVSMVAVISK